VCLVDFGGSSTNITVIAAAKLWFRGLYLGGDAMVAAVAKQLKIDRAAAAKLHRRPDTATWMHQVEEALLPVYDELSEQLRRSLEVCRNDTGQTVDRVLVTGSDSQAIGLLRYLRMGS
jgi:Tfp pilus assembly PilM family ATPase